MSEEKNQMENTTALTDEELDNASGGFESKNGTCARCKKETWLTGHLYRDGALILVNFFCDDCAKILEAQLQLPKLPGQR
ncbi:MAG: hypothetical protein RR226_05985 [Oscillospiraceae bacterium]